MSFLNESDIEARLNSIRSRFNFDSGPFHQGNSGPSNWTSHHDEPAFDDAWRKRFNFKHEDDSDEDSDDEHVKNSKKSKSRGYSSTYSWSQTNGEDPVINRTFHRHKPAYQTKKTPPKTTKSTKSTSQKPTTSKPSARSTSSPGSTGSRERTHPQFKANAHARSQTKSDSDLKANLKVLRQKISDLRNRKY
jgi:hypothetical protein